MALDINSVIFTCLFVTSLVTGFSFLTAYSEKGVPWLKWAALANLGIFLGALLLLGQGTLPPFFSYFLANLLVLSGFVLMEIATRSFLKMATPWAWIIILLTGFCTLFPLFIAVFESLSARILVINLCVSLQLLRTLWILQKPTPDRQGATKSFVFLQSALGLMLVFFVARMIHVLIGIDQSAPGPAGGGLGLILIFLFSAFAIFTWTQGFTNLHHMRIRRKKEEALASREVLFSIIAHDLRGPLISITQGLRAVNQAGTCHEPERDILKATETASEKTFHLLENLLDWARSQKQEIHYHPQKLPIRELVQEAVSPLLKQAADKGLRTTLEGAENLCLLGDRETLKAVVRNLFSNALKFSPPNGQVSILWSAHKASIKLCFKDSGPGFDPALLKDLDKGKTLPSTWGSSGEKGTGLGLSLCRNFVLGNNGTMEIHTSAQGSEIVLTLPGTGS